jgi:hypothetical protein
MKSQVLSRPPTQALALANCKILESRHQYHPCHIQVPDVDKRLAAILVEEKYYSFFKVVRDGQQALEVAAKLSHRGDEITITQTKKGYGIWIWEPEASASAPSDRPQSPVRHSVLATSKILVFGNQYQVRQVRVPDLEQLLMAILVDQKYYSFFKAAENGQQALEIAAKLSQKGDELVITFEQQGYGIWVEELEAYLATPS